MNYRCIILISEPLRCEIAKSGRNCPKNNLIGNLPVKKAIHCFQSAFDTPYKRYFSILSPPGKSKISPGNLLENSWNFISQIL